MKRNNRKINISFIEIVESGLLPEDVDGDHMLGQGASDAWA